jgi:molybdate transport system ATP-binding protein
MGQDEDGLTRLDHAAGPMWLPRIETEVGSCLRLRILAQDVILSSGLPEGLSAMNVLSGRILDLRGGTGPGVIVRVTLDGGEILLARITRRSVERMDLVAGAPVFAVVKSVSVGRENIGKMS